MLCTYSVYTGLYMLCMYKHPNLHYLSFWCAIQDWRLEQQLLPFKNRCGELSDCSAPKKGVTLEMWVTTVRLSPQTAQQRPLCLKGGGEQPWAAVKSMAGSSFYCSNRDKTPICTVLTLSHDDCTLWNDLVIGSGLQIAERSDISLQNNCKWLVFLRWY